MLHGARNPPRGDVTQRTKVVLHGARKLPYGCYTAHESRRILLNTNNLCDNKEHKDKRTKLKRQRYYSLLLTASYNSHDKKYCGAPCGRTVATGSASLHRLALRLRSNT